MAASTPANVTVTMDSPPPSNRSPAITTLVPQTPSAGVTLAISPRLRYSHSPPRTHAPESVVTRMSPLPASMSATITSSLSSETEMISAALPASTTESISLAPASMVEPLISTFVPAWPDAGLALSIEPAATYSQPFSSVVCAPVSRLKTTSPVTASSLPAATTSTTSSDWSPNVSTSTPARKAASIVDPPDRMAVPSILTSVPRCPRAGVKDVISPAAKGVYPPAKVTRAPVSAVITTSTAVATSPPPTSVTKTSVSLSPESTVTSMSPNVTEATLDPPPSNRSPAIATEVPVRPVSGVKPLTSPIST